MYSESKHSYITYRANSEAYRMGFSTVSINKMCDMVPLLKSTHILCWFKNWYNDWCVIINVTDASKLLWLTWVYLVSLLFKNFNVHNCVYVCACQISGSMLVFLDPLYKMTEEIAKKSKLILQLKLNRWHFNCRNIGFS